MLRLGLLMTTIVNCAGCQECVPSHGHFAPSNVAPGAKQEAWGTLMQLGAACLCDWRSICCDTCANMYLDFLLSRSQPSPKHVLFHRYCQDKGRCLVLPW